jgi:hypothetical protein
MRPGVLFRYVLSRFARSFWVEFKKPGEGPTESQARMHKTLRDRGETVYVIDNPEEFKRVFGHHDRACG